MKSATKSVLSELMFSGVVVVIITGTLASPTPSAAQGSQGNNDVYSSSGGQVGSAAFIDASVFLGTTICASIYNVLNAVGYPGQGAVIDARGLNSSNTNMTCAAGTTPWNNGQNYLNKPSTILLPAGVITIPATWILPNGTRVIGEGSTNPYTLPTSAAVPQTAIQACTGTTCTQAFPSGTAMIQFGSNTLCATPCTRVTLEDVTLNGSGLGINGIVNSNSQELSYAKNVAMYQVSGTGLEITGAAENSGPYTNITYDTGNSGGAPSTCAAIYEVAGGTRG